MTIEERDTIILAHLSVVNIVVSKFQVPPFVDKESLTSAGLLGLVEAADSFDSDKNDSFRDFAYIRVRGAIIDYLRSIDLAPRSLRQWQRKIQSCRTFFLTCWQRPGLEKEIADLLQLTWEDYCEISNDLMATNPAASLNDWSSFAQLGESYDETIENRQNKARLAREIKKITPREYIILTLYYHYELSPVAIGEIMKLTKGRIPQILRKIQSELRHACADNTHPPSPSDYLIPLFDNALLPEYVEASLYKPRHHDGM